LLEAFPRRLRLYVFSTVERCQPCTELLVKGGNLGAAGAIMLFEQAQGLAHDFAGRGAAAGFDFSGDEFVQFGGEGNIDCIARRKECRTSSELMPAAVSIYKADKREANKPPSEDILKDLPLWVAARDAEYVERVSKTCLVSGHDFSRAENCRKIVGF
jgi:hypothetical protein